MASSDNSGKPIADPSFGRRTFLRQSLVSLGSTVQEFVKHRDAPAIKESEPKNVPLQKGWLRPPGAVRELDFLERCTKCGDCVDACPHQVIKNLLKDETPAIFPGEGPCQLCDDLPCIAACETDALMPLSGLDMVDMGLAVVSAALCTAGNGCNACVSRCPMSALSMDFSLFSVTVDSSRCVGCGLCQFICGTVNDQMAIRVMVNGK